MTDKLEPRDDGEQRARLLKSLGPGLITGAADDDPSGIATYSQAGAQLGVNMLWTMLFAAYAVGESRGWTCGLEHQPKDAPKFHMVIVLAVLLGFAVDYSPFDPIRALFWSAVLNGIISVPIMAATMIVASSRKQMGELTATLSLRILGWAATGVMAASTIAMFLLG